MGYIEEHEQRVIKLIDELFAAKLALMQVRNTLRAARAAGVVIEEILVEPGVTLLAYVERHLRS